MLSRLHESIEIIMYFFNINSILIQHILCLLIAKHAVYGSLPTNINEVDDKNILLSWQPVLPTQAEHARRILVINPISQTLGIFEGDTLKQSYRISTSLQGMGQTFGSYMTPIGWHRICRKIGKDLPTGSVFVHQQPTGSVWKPGDRVLADGILSRILVLDGLQDGLNRKGLVDTRSRSIYIHGTCMREDLGRPVSHGCIRMDPDEIVALFNRVSVGDLVLIAGTPPKTGPTPWL